MSLESARGFVKRMQEDRAFRERIRNAKRDSLMDEIRSAGYDFSLGERQQARDELPDARVSAGRAICCSSGCSDSDCTSDCCSRAEYGSSAIPPLQRPL